MAAAEEHQPLIDQFTGITSAAPDVAAFFLESHNWDLEAALHSFYEDPQPQTLAAGDRRRPDEGAENDEDDDDYMPSEEEEAAPPARVSRGAKRPARAAAGRSNIRGFGDLNRSPGSEDDEEEEEMQEFYTGGEKSGMLVQDPSRGNNNVDAIFEDARQAAVAPYQPSSSSRSFTGTGRTIAGDTVAAPAQPPESVLHNVYLWSNGFTVDDGPLRRFDDPANIPFLESIRKSECPKELEPADRRTKVRVNLERKEEKYREPARRPGAFQGVGRTLGSGETSEVPVSEASAPSAAAPSHSPAPSMGLTVDDSRPCTSIQLRLADGTRMVARFNTTHTISDIRAFIDASRPGARTYQLQTVGFPPAQLNDLTKTIEEAGLSNSVVIQKL